MILKIILGIVGIILVFGMVLGLYAYSLSKIEVGELKIKDFEVKEIGKFSFNGNINAINRGILPVKISKITYEIIIPSENQKVTDGTINGVLLIPNKESEFNFTSEINWKPKLNLSWELYRENLNKIELKGKVYLGFYLFEIPVSFTQTIDISDYIDKLKEKFTEDLVSNIINSNNGINMINLANQSI